METRLDCPHFHFKAHKSYNHGKNNFWILQFLLPPASAPPLPPSPSNTEAWWLPHFACADRCAMGFWAGAPPHWVQAASWWWSRPVRARAARWVSPPLPARILLGSSSNILESRASCWCRLLHKSDETSHLWRTSLLGKRIGILLLGGKVVDVYKERCPPFLPPSPPCARFGE